MAEIVSVVAAVGNIAKEAPETMKKTANTFTELLRLFQKVTIVITNFFGQEIYVQLPVHEHTEWTTIQNKSAECFYFREKPTHTTCDCIFECENGGQRFLVHDGELSKRTYYNYKIREKHLVEGNKNQVLFDWGKDWLKPTSNARNFRVNNEAAARNPVPIHHAVETGQCEDLRKLLDDGADVNELANYDEDNVSSVSALHLAAGCGHKNCVKLLLQRGANIEQENSALWTPLHYASFFGQFDVVTLLLDNNANIYARTLKGYTPFYLASSNGHVEVAELVEPRCTSV